ncbi:MAG TPA: leucyl/phenylalanyl-tRNA--protein transferase [Acidimicrobiales bacterium]|nr:leucyl/phenylalanyl-tRNA--protein transferase [Acidimicrobiales bacterium]
MLPPATEADPHGLVGIGGDLEPGTILAAYRSGLFPMPVDVGRRDEALGWWSPDPRAVLPLDGLRVSRSLRRSCRDLEVRVDTAFDEVVAGCAAPNREGRWITDEVAEAYVRLHELGWAHSVEAWRGDDLVGGLYGIAIGGLFAGESMFHRTADASKVALVRLVSLLREGGGVVLDVQWTTPHLESLGAVDIPRPRYLELLADALSRPLPEAFT